MVFWLLEKKKKKVNLECHIVQCFTEPKVSEKKKIAEKIKEKEKQQKKKQEELKKRVITFSSWSHTFKGWVCSDFSFFFFLRFNKTYEGLE